jgi:hypothetical protein
MKSESAFFAIIFIIGALILTGCDKNDAAPDLDTISYIIVNNSSFEPTVEIAFTNENGGNTDLNDPSLPWEVSFKPGFDTPQVLVLNALCDCDMTALILVNGKVVGQGKGSNIDLDYTYQ